jgi:hypothetical protein
MMRHFRQKISAKLAQLRSLTQFWPIVLWVVIATSGLTVTLAQTPTRTNAGVDRFEVALIGDLPYSEREEQQFANLVTDINRSNAAFVVHDGDIKSGGSLCTDEIFLSRRSLFNTFRAPFVLILGDNEWTDCHRKGGDPLERLTKLRNLFFAADTSLGQTTLKLEQQSKIPEFATYRENVRWRYGSVLFVGLHVVGSNNNLGRTPEMDQEFQARNQANLAWLRSSFAIARDQDLKGVMVIIQANPGFEKPRDQRTGFNDFLDTLQTEVMQFNQPVVLVHGDSHQFQINKPMLSGPKQRVMNFTRVETFGTPDVHWVKATIDAADPNLFRFETMLVKANLN